MRYILFLISFILISVYSFSQSRNLDGTWQIIEKVTNNTDGWIPDFKPGTKTKWAIKLNGNKLEITSIRETSQFNGSPNVETEKLEIEDWDFSNNRLQIIVNKIWDGDLGILYEKKYYDLKLSSNSSSASGTYTKEVSSGDNDPLKIKSSGTVALRKLGSGSFKKKDSDLKIQR